MNDSLPYPARVLLAVDRLAAAALGARDKETLSAYAYRLELAGCPWAAFWRRFIDALVWQIEQDHCARSYIRNL